MSEWRTPETLPEVGDVVEVQLTGPFGPLTLRGDFFLHDDGEWYQADPPARLAERPYRWRHRMEYHPLVSIQLSVPPEDSQ